MSLVTYPNYYGQDSGPITGTGSIREHEIFRRYELLEEELNEALEAVTGEDCEVNPDVLVIENARSLFVHLLPFVSPVISCLPEGEICFQWTKRPSSILTLSVSGGGSLTYAATLRSEGERHCGTVRFNENGLPVIVEIILRKYFASEDMKWIQTSPTMSH